MLRIFGVVAGNMCMSKENVNSWKSKFLKKQKLRPIRPLTNSEAVELKPIKPMAIHFNLNILTSQ
jgi:hypothetical protein